MGLCLGYEDLNDHDELCRDRMMALVRESDDVMGERRHRESDVGKPLAGKSTLNRMELRPEQDKHRRYRKIEADKAGLDSLLVDVFLEAHEGDASLEVVLDVEARGSDSVSDQAVVFSRRPDRVGPPPLT